MPSCSGPLKKLIYAGEYLWSRGATAAEDPTIWNPLTEQQKSGATICTGSSKMYNRRLENVDWTVKNQFLFCHYDFWIIVEAGGGGGVMVWGDIFQAHFGLISTKKASCKHHTTTSILLWPQWTHFQMHISRVIVQQGGPHKVSSACLQCKYVFAHIYIVVVTFNHMVLLWNFSDLHHASV